MQLSRYTYSKLNDAEKSALCKRPKIDFASVFSTVQPIIDAVQKDGDKAVHHYNEQFDGVSLDSLVMDVPPIASIKLKPEVKKAFDVAYANIKRFHEAQRPLRLEVETMPGVICAREIRPIERVGLYVPGGTAVLPSSTLMLGVPAQIAGCKDVIVATPPAKDGSVPAEVLYCAALCGVSTIVKAGGAQAIAALAFGTKSVPKVDKILGPGNQYVTAAKLLLQNSDAMISIDMPAGPSEVLVIADSTARPSFVAADLLSQAEHGSDSQVILVAIKGFDLAELDKQLASQLAALPRKEFATNALKKSHIIHVETEAEAIEFSNLYAPEHLIIQTENPDRLVSLVEKAGSVFLGPWTPESLGDYASGTNHTLPTYGYARMYSGVSLLSFVNFITFQKANREGLKKLGPYVEIMAQTEGLQAHKNAVSIRLKEIK
ncbi:histidinol dehydrogenase [bacterium]|nr:MAG: histidinol dehydrogenase [bacterium]